MSEEALSDKPAHLDFPSGFCHISTAVYQQILGPDGREILRIQRLSLDEDDFDFNREVLLRTAKRAFKTK